MDRQIDKRRLKFATRSRLFDHFRSERRADGPDPPSRTGTSAGETSRKGSESAPDPAASKSHRSSSEALTPTDKEALEDDGYYENPMSDENRACIKVWLQTEDEGNQDVEVRGEDYDTALERANKKFDEYKHHYFDGQWRIDSEEKAHEERDEEWFIHSTPVLEKDDPEHLCDMCRHIDFATLLTCRDLPGNNQPGPSTIELRALPRVLDEETRCSFCTLVRQGMQDLCTPEEINAARAARAARGTKNGKMRLSVLDDGPEYALRLEVELEGLAPRMVVQNAGTRTNRASTPRPLSSIASGPPALRLIDVEEDRIVAVATPCRYACLSYVWGGEVGTQLTSKTRSVLESTGGLTDPSIHLGQTLQDAIKVTKDIGLQYL
ncbi:hypothetical protein MFIFM68171_02847 [Madurella fahalii]|uniref:Heterokaryon incompatibility domain-containing protein n=1 Tax=Madurella fahalii TaxID=1157608 RepID=A0ABQ0G4E8_9PEZI